AMAVQVFTRYVLGSSLTGTEELGRYSFIWMTMLGASICVSSDSHAAVTILNDHLKWRMKGGHKISVDILILACAVLLFIQGIKMAAMSTRQLTPTL
ncbi:TRAP transporter small permease, partial [[Clostridium] symbiosum]|uniref:TRAP transporter small permease n=1 Tax=Clostridium symbiosum TaxID=1512 RepID=UPI00210CA8C6